MTLNRNSIYSNKEDAVKNGRLRPRCCHLANWTKHNVVLDFGPLAPLRENIALVRGGPSHSHK